VLTRYCYSHGYGYADSDANTYADVCSNTKTASNPATSPVSLYSQVIREK
jgi:hypothetical protein